MPWIAMGDFNEVLTHVIKLGGPALCDTQIDQFRNTVDYCGLHDLPFSGARYTWHNNCVNGTNVKERLDYAFINNAWPHLFGATEVSHLDFFKSDHRALLLSLNHVAPAVSQRFKSRFHFEALWLKEEEASDIILKNWVTSIADPILQIANNLSACSFHLQTWHRRKYGELPRQINST
uniref:Endonuclease/exonuclease/phosphatase domain-containing protein n=1 Tax=Cannabis sativa TaxID=3483 RepID=A0A803NKW4_CANSA